SRERQNQKRNERLRYDQSQRMRQISREDCNQSTRQCHVAKRDPFKRAARLPRVCQFTLNGSAKVLQREFSGFTLRPGQNRFIGIEAFLLLHRALSGTIFANFVFGRTSLPHFTMVQACRRAACRKPESGFTAKGFPTLASIHSSG